MKKTHGILILTLFLSHPIFSQTLFTYGGKPVSKQEFLKAYNKNNNGKADEKSMRDYLDLYEKFKLKVQSAYDLRLDTISTQKAELQSFRNQLIPTYLNDSESFNRLVNEAYSRGLKDIRVSHIFIPAKIKDSPQFVIAAGKKIHQAFLALQKGKNFGDAALEYSSDPSVKVNKGDMGYITVFTLPYELETIAYNTPTGKFSNPYKSNAGFHIFKKTAERKAVGKVKVAHILLAFPPGADDASKEQIKKRADSIYSALLNGADFGDMASKYTSDNFSYQTKGEIPEFGVGQYEPSFEDAAFSLKKDGEISKPVLTEYGYHIIKRISRKPVPEVKSKSYMDELRQTVSNDDRIEVSKKAMHEKIMNRIGYKKGNFDHNQLWVYTDSILNNKPVPAKTVIRPNNILFSFTKQNVTVNDWLNFRRSTYGVERITGGKTNQELLDYFTEIAAMEYYKNHLEEFSKEFAYQVKEFRDGNLLFETMQRNVWDKAAADSTGLKKYFESHKNKYWWENSADAILFTATNQTTANEMESKLKLDINNWRKIAEVYEGNVIVDSGRFEVDQLPLPPNYQVRANSFSGQIKNQTDSSISFIYIIRPRPERTPRSFEEAKGFVINDYQVYLEDAWINELKKKYPIHVDEAVFKSMLK